MDDLDLMRALALAANDETLPPDARNLFVVTKQRFAEFFLKVQAVPNLKDQKMQLEKQVQDANTLVSEKHNEIEKVRRKAEEDVTAQVEKVDALRKHIDSMAADPVFMAKWVAEKMTDTNVFVDVLTTELEKKQKPTGKKSA